MADTEEYFPRGGKKPTVKYFKQSGNFLGAAEQGEGKKKKPKKKTEGDDGYLSDEAPQDVDVSYKNCAIGLSYKTAKPGVLILGRVRKVHETKLKLMLPCKMIGTVMACHISEPYNKLLEAYVNDQTEKVKELPEMFKPGQYVAVKVLEAGHEHLMLSMMPQHVNGSKLHSDLHNGCLLQAAVASVEDHGYVMDIGIPNTRAFLPKKSANPEVELEPGCIAWCCVKSVSAAAEGSVVTLSGELEALQQAVQRKRTKSLLPATALEFTVDKALENGIEGRVFGETTAYVQRQHTDKASGKRPALGQKIRARVLYVMPTRNTPFLTTRNIFEVTYPDLDQEQKYQEGDIIEEAQVVKITGRSIHFRLGRGCAGTMSLRRIQIDEDLSDEEVIAKSYPVGSTHKVRVLSYNLSDYSYSVSDQPSIIAERYFSLQDLAPGDLVDATVRAVNDSQVFLTVGRLTGCVPHAHLSDAGLFIDPKKASTSKLPKKKYKVGQDVKARVLAVDLEKNQLFLTLKPTLLSPDLEVLKSYEEAQIGKAYTGVIKHIRDYVLVAFFNGVLAFVQRHNVTREPLPNLLDAFHVGQLVNCTILWVDAAAKKMAGSLITPPFTPREQSETHEKRKRKSDDSDTVPNKKKVNEESVEIPKKKKKPEKESDEQVEIGSKDRKKKKDKTSKVQGIDELDSTEKQTEISNKKDHKKKKDKKSDIESSDVTVEVTEMDIKKDRKRKKDLKEHEETKISDESDAIETDIYEDSDQVLTPQDLGLIDLSDCDTAKRCKKRVVSLIKAIKARTRRLDTIDKKIINIEERGLNAKNKKFHTAMHMEKLVVEARIKKLMEVLPLAQEKLKEYDIEKPDYKKKKVKEVKERKEESKEVVKEVIGEREVKRAKNEEVTVEKLEPVLKVPSFKDFLAGNVNPVSKAVPEEDSSSSEDEEEEQPKKKRKKLTVAEKLAKVREEEERVREMEKRAIESESQPRSSEQFERALLANPASSQLWIAYMAFHLQATEVDRARAVGRKALASIPFREEHERLNVWLALLNTEHRFGTKESQQKTLEEALQMNDTFKVHSKLLDILVDTGKHQELSALVDLMMRKYKRDPTCYTQCGAACFKLGLVDKARHVMQKAISVLEKKEHVSILVQFALLERSSGAVERAEALFEQMLAVYPQRVDVCAVYIDMLFKSGDVEHVRQVMERMTSQKLPARKMKVLYKKWIEAEEKIGDAAHVEEIRQRAVEYIDKAKF